MTIAKHIEAIAIALIAVAAAASMAAASVPKASTVPGADAVTTHVVYVSAKRLNAAEKAAL